MAEERDRAEEPADTGSAAGGPGGEAPLSDTMADLLGKILRRGRVELEKAARKGRERLTLRQLRSDRDRMYQKLGKEARQLLESAEIDHPGLRRGVDRIRELEARILEAEDAARSGGESVEEPPDPDGAEEP